MIDAKSLLLGANSLSSGLADRLLAGKVTVFSTLNAYALMQIADNAVKQLTESIGSHIELPLNMAEIVIESLGKDCSARNIYTKLENLVGDCESAVYDKFEGRVHNLTIKRHVETLPEKCWLLTTRAAAFLKDGAEDAKLRHPEELATLRIDATQSLLLDLHCAEPKQWETWLKTIKLRNMSIVGFAPSSHILEYVDTLSHMVKIVGINSGVNRLADLVNLAQHRAFVLANIDDRKRRFIQADFEIEVDACTEGTASVILRDPQLSTAFNPHDFDVPFMRLHQPSIYFSDVVGCDALKQELRLIKKQLLNKKINPADIPKGLLFSGPPGTGKTFMAEALAGELDLPFIVINSADIVTQGNPVTNIKSLFSVISKISPCVVFFDEMDSLGRARNENNSSHSLSVNTLLANMDGITGNSGICMFIAATNFSNLLDPALLRAGRFEREVNFKYPTSTERLSAIESYAKEYNVTLSQDELKALAAITENKTYKALQNGFRDAVRNNNLASCGFKDVVIAMFGTSNACPKKLNTIAVHEAGHYVASIIMKPHATVAMLSAKFAMTALDENQSEQIISKRTLHSHLVCLLAGRAAEAEIFGEEMVSLGSWDDMRHATRLAKETLVCTGSCNQLEAVDLSQLASFTPVLEDETTKLIQLAYSDAKRFIRLNRKIIEALAEKLVTSDYLLKNDLAEYTHILHRDEKHVVNLH